jgi:HEAT repeat protein
VAGAAQLVGLAETEHLWVWAAAGSIAALLVLLNLVLLVAVHARRLRQVVRGRRATRCRARVEEVLAELEPQARGHDPQWLRTQVERFDELERPIAASMLIERMKPAAEEERREALEYLREAGVIDVLMRATRRRMPWRRALAIRTLGWVGADEAVPVLLDRLADRNRHVREAAVRALGRIGDDRALAHLGELFLEPGAVAAGVVYDALIAYGPAASPIFRDGLGSPLESVRVAACFGIAAAAEADAARALLEPALSDEHPPVRAAAAEGLGHVGSGSVPDRLAAASRDEHAAVRRAAIRALGAFDDAHAVELAAAALPDPDREAAIRAAEALVRLSHLPAAADAARDALGRSEDTWTVERARTLASLGAA